MPGSLGLKLFSDAQASISVPSTEKCSLDSNRFTLGGSSTAPRNRPAISPASNRSRFFENVEWSHTASSIPSPTNQRNSRSYSSRSISCRSERIEYNACGSIARNSRSGAVEGRPIREYSAAKSALSLQRHVRDLPDRTRRVVPPNPRLQVDVAEQLTRPLVPAAHQSPDLQTDRVNHADVAQTRHFFNSLLGELGYQVREAKDGQEALQMLDADIHLLFSDVVMPGVCSVTNSRSNRRLVSSRKSRAPQSNT